MFKALFYVIKNILFSIEESPLGKHTYVSVMHTLSCYVDTQL